MTTSKKARETATLAIHATLTGQGSLDSVLNSKAATSLSPGERTLARMIASTTVRNWYHLNQILSELLDHPFRAKDSILTSLLLGGLAQLAFTRQAEHAVVTETVALAPELGKPWGRGVCNAVLRNFLRQKSRLLMQKHSEEAQLNHPAWLIGKLKKAYPDQWREVINANNQRAPMVIRVNAQKCTASDYLARLGEMSLDAERLGDSTIELAAPVDVSRLPMFSQGWVSVQDSHAQLAARWIRTAPGMRILDACAAPGGKTCHLLEQEPELNLTALDNHPERLKRVSQNLERLGLSAELVCEDASVYQAEPFDGILLDAPCSGTGVIRRHPDIRIARDPEQIKQSVALQARLLDHCFGLLKPGGQLLYVTCSVLPEENHKQISAFLERTPGAELDPITHEDAYDVPVGVQLLPGSGDGFYYASLVKSAAHTGDPR